MANINVNEVLSKLTDSEKIELLAGIDFWHTAGLPKYGIPSLRLSDGPNGVRGTKNFAGVAAACFPCGTALGATWDSNLLETAGVLMDEESIAKGVHVLLGPCINMQRSPLGGRGFESLSEDPVLAGFGAAALIRGIQSTGVVATIKHFVCNDQEHERGLYDAQITNRALRELYLLPFQIAVRDSDPHAFMTAYNKLNGIHVSENRILAEVLRGEWRWNGLVMGDWFGTYSTSEAINAGLDLEMPGPTRFRGESLMHAYRSNKVSRVILDDRVREILETVKRCASSGIPENAEEQNVDTPETAALLRKFASSAVVLMKNSRDILPLKKAKSTVIIGPNAKVSTYCGGGSSSLPPYYAITPFDGICKKLNSEPRYAIGCYSHKELPLLGLQLKQTTDGAQPGFNFKAYNQPPSVHCREVVDKLTLTKSDMILLDYKCSKITSPLWYAEIDGYLTAEEEGQFELGLCVYGTAKLYVDDKLVIDNETVQTQGSVFYGCGTVEERGTIAVKKGTKYHIKVTFASAPTSKLEAGGVVRFGGGGLRIGGCQIIDAEAELAHAAALAREADQVIICAGLNGDWEGEGADRDTMSLPGNMDALISACAAANPNTIVVMQSGTPVSMPWISEVAALIQAWYGGNETGNAIADILFGDVNPSGKLPLSFPVKNEDNPAFLNYRSERGRTLYGEDVYIGYRYYEKVKKEVLFPFGHGLSYSTFRFENLGVANDGKLITVTLSVKNTGKVEGAEVVQVYVSQHSPSIQRPRKELKGFSKVTLKAGETKKISLTIETKYAAAFWDEERRAWIMEKDVYDLVCSDSSFLDEKKSLTGTFEVTETTWWNGL